MTIEGEIGQLFSPHQLEEAALGILQRWLPLYVAEVERQHGQKLPPIASWGLENEDDERWPEQALPALIVIAGGIGAGGEPEKHSNGWYRATWKLSVTVIVEAARMVDARQVAQLYGAAVRGALLQRRSEKANGRITTWISESNPYQVVKKRTEAASQNTFLITHDEVVNWQMGPKGDEPPDEPPGPAPEITEVDVDVEVN